VLERERERAEGRESDADNHQKTSPNFYNTKHTTLGNAEKLTKHN